MIGVMVENVREVDALPPGIRLVRDFVNTVEWQVDADMWRRPSDLADWFAARTAWRRRALDFNDLALARRVREGLRSVLLMHAGHDPLATTLADLNDALRLVPLRISFDEAAAFGLSSARDASAAQPLAHILDAVETARAGGSWNRLKACSRDSCRWAYWDDSRNRSGRWCSMAGCGNHIKMRRRNEGPEAVVGAVIEESAPRVPTLIDVAGRAGVSIKTVSNVVTGTIRVAEPTRARVTAAIEELGYSPNLAARALASGRRKASPHADSGRSR